jgi:DNA-binding response OmpR family regulator
MNSFPPVEDRISAGSRYDSSDLATMRVLVVEDQERILSFVEKGLKAQGFIVDTTRDGDEGYSFATTEPYDALVLDIMLPGRDGLSILKNLRKKGNSVPSIAADSSQRT